MKQIISEKWAKKQNLQWHKDNILFFLLAHIDRWPAAWAKDLSSEVCFRSISSFGDPQYLSRTSPHSIQFTWNSRIWNFEFRKTLRNLWNFVSCKRFRPVVQNWMFLVSQETPKDAQECDLGLGKFVGYFHVFPSSYLRRRKGPALPKRDQQKMQQKSLYIFQTHEDARGPHLINFPHLLLW